MWKKLTEVDGEINAKIIEGLLKTNNIECVLEIVSEPFPKAYFGSSTFFAIYVKENDFEIAKNLINPNPI
ncbi:hypothetical protein SU69_09515 [Thermosipho melanesiensis]|uniref:DUF2007 domain-containing protein n=3 Tax=Thermosipho melanesiensis TaxID=46541 RepID=A6LP66_THEM4|nr:DUF2007 domain-containing protein [Thermosipho melanesiensis]ABR31717.1 hypothetical protein Tmel_1884 [Thermosipho melanesiensis BI429]APT74960.1 hypothetical protein BW47_09900 [Thermosipho melanesiensis]OOC35242.1 hypothetical protein SU69_09515 [Thermosipho melanesiensis]OOC35452.1 hypothetical protein SU70_09525 [Thermosipho melanesiensis]OOC36703.1 hypothetical protein SU68_09585 [Thermosipho melanesiensis]